MLGTEYLVAGQLKPISGGRYQLEFSLLNVTAQKTVLTHKVSGSLSQMRDWPIWSATRYTGDNRYRGAFSTRLAYVNAVRNNGKYTYRLNVADADGAREKLVLESSQLIMSPACPVMANWPMSLLKLVAQPSSSKTRLPPSASS